MIPKIIHQTAKTTDIPLEWSMLSKKVQTLHPGWEYRFWTDEDNLAFVRAEFPSFLEVYQSLPKNIMRADVIRYLLMYLIGGMYLDLDYEMLKEFDLLQYSLVLPANRSTEIDNYEQIGNCIFASEPGHPFWKIVIDDLLTNPPRINNDLDILSATGPIYLTKILNQFSAAERKALGIYVPERMSFHPPTPQTTQEYQEILQNPTCYGIHHCHGTWLKANTRLASVKHFIKSAFRG